MRLRVAFIGHARQRWGIEMGVSMGTQLMLAACVGPRPGYPSRADGTACTHKRALVVIRLSAEQLTWNSYGLDKQVQ